MDGPVVARLVRCSEENVEELVRSQTKVARSIEAARALVGQVMQELRNAYNLLTSPHPSDPASLELTTRKLIRTAGLLARHLTERAAFEEALPTLADQILLPLLAERKETFQGVRLEAFRACARLLAAFPELMVPRTQAVMDAVCLVLSLSRTQPSLLPEAQLALEVVQLHLAHDPTHILPRVPALLTDIAALIGPEPPSPFSVLELLTVLAHLLDGCCDADHFAVPAPALTAALTTHSINANASFWLQLSSALLALAAQSDHQSAALSALEALGHFVRNYLPHTLRRDVQTQMLPALTRLLGGCTGNTEWQVLRAMVGYVPGLSSSDLDSLFASLEAFVKKLAASNLKPALRDKQRNAAVSVATALVRESGPRLVPHLDRVLVSLLAPLRDPLLCAELIQALASDAPALAAFLPRLLSGLLAYAKSTETSWQLLREVFETLGLIAEHGGRAAAPYAAEILSSVLATLPRGLLHAGAEGLTCIRRVLLAEGVTDRVITDHSVRVCNVIWNVLREKFDGAEPLEEDEADEEIDLDSGLMLEALNCAQRLATHPRVGIHFNAFAEALVEFLLGAILKPLLLEDDTQVRAAQVDALVQLLVQRPKLRNAERLRKAKQAMGVAAELLRDEEEEEAAKDVEKQIEKLAQL